MSEQKKASSFKRLYHYMSCKKTVLIGAVIFLVLSTALSVLAPKAVGMITDSIENNVAAGSSLDFKCISFMLIILMLLHIGCNFFLYKGNKFVVNLSQGTVKRLRQEIQLKLEKVPLSYIDTQQRGDLLARATSDMIAVTTMLESNMAQMVTQIALVVGTIAMMLVNNVVLGAIFILLIPASMFSIKFITTTTRKLFKQQLDVLGELNAHIEEMINGHEVMKAFNYEEAAARHLDLLNEDLFKSYLRSRTFSGFINPIIKILNNSVYIAICVLGGYFVLQGRLTIGGLLSFLMYAQNISTPISQFSVNLNNLQSGLAAATRVFELLDTEEEGVDKPRTEVNRDIISGAVSFKNVKFGYVPEKTLMHDVSFDVKPGQTVAIVGPSGAGKTTLVNLLMRFYDINNGDITLDENSIFDISRKNLRECIGMVLQDTWIFDGTIAENIGYGNPKATRNDIINAAVKAQCDQFIRILPNGYDTFISEAASSLSTGEKQLLSIARTIIAEPKILILDEATSSIDTRTEVLITTAMNNMMEGRTSFIIAHRLFTIRNADAIIFMKDGDILEVGNHNQLIAKGGYYAEMYNSSSD